MTARPASDAEKMAALDARFTPQRVDLNLHGGSHTLIYLLDGQYYTAERIRPDFPKVKDDTKLVLGDPTDARAQKLRDREHELDIDGHINERLNANKTCELLLLQWLLRDNELVFDISFRAYLGLCRLEDIEPTNRSYYDALKRFTTMWLKLEKLLTEG